MPTQEWVSPTAFAKELLLCFYQAFFIENRSDFAFDPDEKRSKIFICDKFAYNREVAEQRPGLFTDRGALRWHGRHIDQFIGSNAVGAERQYADLLEVMVRVHCVAKEGLRAERLAVYAFMLPMIYKDLLRRDRRIHNVISTGMSSESILKRDSRPDLSLVVVDIQVLMNVNFSALRSEAPLLEAFRIVVNDPEKLYEFVARQKAAAGA